MQLKVEERDVYVDKLEEFTEAGACGTAAVIAPIGSITHNGRKVSFYDNGNSVGPVTKKLYDILTQIQIGDICGPDNWVVEI